MTRRIDAKTVLTVAVLLGVFAVALLRSNHWQLPSSWNGLEGHRVEARSLQS